MKKQVFLILNQNNFVTHEKSFFVRALSFLFLMNALGNLGCVKNGKPHVQDLIRVKLPSFDGQVLKNGKMTATFATPAMAYTLNGKCDPASYLLEYSSNNGQSWTEISGACTTGQFSINVSLVNGYMEVLVRARGKFNYTDSVKAKIRFLRPPTSNSLYFAASSKADTSDDIGIGSQNIMPETFSGEEISGTTVTYKNYLPALAHE